MAGQEPAGWAGYPHPLSGDRKHSLYVHTYIQEEKKNDCIGMLEMMKRDSVR
jgi:hypothetical protein